MTYPTQGPAPAAAMEFRCPQCNGEMQYDAGIGGLKCKYCRHTVQVQVPPGAAGPREIPLREGYARAPRGLGVAVQTFQCRDCGATVNIGPNERTASCTYCASNTVMAVQSDPNLIQPESMVPFRVTKEKASEGFKSWLASLWFRPSNLKHMAQIEQIAGVYVPYWTFDAHVESQWEAERGWYYYVTETYTTEENGQTVTKTREVRHTRWEYASGWRKDNYDDVLVCGSKGLPEKIANKLETFNTAELVAYAPGYLAGWRAESYAVDLQNAWPVAQTKMEKQQISKCKSDVGGDEQRGLNVRNQYSRETFKHVLLPLYVAAYRYNNKPFRLLVNGQTGEVQGEAPYSWVKIMLAVLGFIAFVGAIVAIYMIFFNEDNGSAMRAIEQGSNALASLQLMAQNAVG